VFRGGSSYQGFDKEGVRRSGSCCVSEARTADRVYNEIGL
jgi:hypothetical protein